MIYTIGNDCLTVSANSLGAQLGDLGESFLFVVHVPLDGIDQHGDQVMTALKLYTDAAPGLIHHIFSIHHAVIEQNEAYGDR